MHSSSSGLHELASGPFACPGIIKGMSRKDHKTKDDVSRSLGEAISPLILSKPRTTGSVVVPFILFIFF